MRILFITANRLGDAVLSTGVLAGLIERYPTARITIVCGPYAAGLFRAVPNLERCITLTKQSWNRHWLKVWRECWATRWDVIVDLRNSIVSRLLWRRRLACRHGGNTGQHKVIENAAVLKLTPPPAPHLWLDATAESDAARLMPVDRPVLALGPAANWIAKQWPIDRFAALAERLTAPDGLLAGAHVMVIADGRERDQIAPLLRAIPDERRIELIGSDLLTVAACLKRASLFVGNDSGLMHVAAAIGTPTLGLFGPGYEHIYGPWGPHGAFIRTPESREDLLSRLPPAGQPVPNLMTGLTVDAVVEAVNQQLNILSLKNSSDATINRTA